jgi:hypothetical protein
MKHKMYFHPGLWRFLVVPVALAVASSLVLAACGTAPFALTATVPWRPIPASPTTTTTTTTTTLAPAPPCKASQLSPSKGRGGAATGHIETTIVFSNRGPTCRLGGYPRLIGFSSTRRHVSLTAHHGTFFESLIPVDLAHGRQALLLLGTEDMCSSFSFHSAKDTYDEVVIIFPKGEGELTARTYPFDTICGLDESELGILPPPAALVPPPPAPPGSPGSLSVTVHLPASAKSGEVLSYTVSLHNSTKVAVDLHHCPDYTEILGYPFKTVRTYTLNCTRARPIRPGQTRVFEMKIPTPKVTTPTTVKFLWQLDTALGPVAGGALQIVPAT